MKIAGIASRVNSVVRTTNEMMNRNGSRKKRQRPSARDVGLGITEHCSERRHFHTVLIEIGETIPVDGDPRTDAQRYHQHSHEENPGQEEGWSQCLEEVF